MIVLFVIISVAVAIVTAHTPAEWKDIFDNIKE
jgi:hypothetical protein